MLQIMNMEIIDSCIKTWGPSCIIYQGCVCLCGVAMFLYYFAPIHNSSSEFYPRCVLVLSLATLNLMSCILQ